MNLEGCGPQRGKKQDFLSQVALDTDRSPRIKRKKSLSGFQPESFNSKDWVLFGMESVYQLRWGYWGGSVRAREGLELGPCGHCGFEWMTLLN